MEPVSGPVIKDVVLVGAGHAHVQVLRRFGMKPLAGVRFTLITREVHTPYSGMLPGLVAGIYGFDDVHIDTGPLSRFAHARLYQSAALGIDIAGRRVICDNRPPVPYDLLSVNTGSTPNTAQVPGAAEHAIPVKPIDHFLSHFEALRARISARRKRRVALVGAGPGGVELLLALEQRLRHEAREAGRNPGDLSFVLVSGGGHHSSRLPCRFPPPLRDHLRWSRHRDRRWQPGGARRARPVASERTRACRCRRNSVDDRGPPARMAEDLGAAGR